MLPLPIPAFHFPGLSQLLTSRLASHPSTTMSLAALSSKTTGTMKRITIFIYFVSDLSQAMFPVLPTYLFTRLMHTRTSKTKKVLLSGPWGNWGLERFCELAKVTQFANHKGIWTQVYQCLRPKIFPTTIMLSHVLGIFDSSLLPINKDHSQFICLPNSLFRSTCSPIAPYLKTLLMWTGPWAHHMMIKLVCRFPIIVLWPPTSPQRNNCPFSGVSMLPQLYFSIMPIKLCYI